MNVCVTFSAEKRPVKSEWEFQFETRGFRFDREYKYVLKPDRAIPIGNRRPERVECFVRIAPKKDAPPPLIDQVGSLFITLPHSETETRDFAIHVARLVSDRITFQHGDFRIHYGLILCKRIAETPEEESEFGENLISIEMHFEEVVAPLNFDSNRIVKIPSTPQHAALMSQFNETKRDKGTISQYLGYFRILESIYHASDEKRPLMQVLLGSDELRKIYNTLVKDGSYDTLVQELVDIRHRCAHLRLAKGFGYAPSDPAVEQKVRPRLPLLAALAHCSIMGLDAHDHEPD